MKKVLLLILIAVGLIVSGCKSSSMITEIPVVVSRESLDKLVSVRVDTITIRDSVDRYMASDTVYVTRYRQVTRYKFSVDTIIKIDTVPKVVTNTVTKIVEVNKRGVLDKTLMILGIIFVVYVFLRIFILKS